MVSHVFTWFHTFSLGFTWFHMVSHGFTWFHIFSLGFTHFHLISHIFTLVSHVFTYFHMFSRCEKVWKSVRWITSKKKKKKKNLQLCKLVHVGLVFFQKWCHHVPQGARSVKISTFQKKKSSVPGACGAAKLREVAYSSVASPEYFIVKIWEVKLMAILY